MLPSTSPLSWRVTVRHSLKSLSFKIRLKGSFWGSFSSFSFLSLKFHVFSLSFSYSYFSSFPSFFSFSTSWYIRTISFFLSLFIFLGCIFICYRFLLSIVFFFILFKSLSSFITLSRNSLFAFLNHLTSRKTTNADLNTRSFVHIHYALKTTWKPRKLNDLLFPTVFRGRESLYQKNYELWVKMRSIMFVHKKKNKWFMKNAS